MRYSERLMVGEVPSKVLGFQGFAAAADVNRVAGLVTYQNGRAVFIDGKLGPIFSSISQVQMSADGNSVLYTGTKDEKHYIVLNGDVSPGYDWVGKLCLWPDGKLIAYPVMQETSGKRV